jgi:hypothetical protein
VEPCSRTTPAVWLSSWFISTFVMVPSPLSNPPSPSSRPIVAGPLPTGQQCDTRIQSASLAATDSSKPRSAAADNPRMPPARIVGARMSTIASSCWAVGVAGTMAGDAAAAVFDMDRGQAERAPHLGRQVGDTVAEASSLFCTEGIKFKLWRSWKAWKFAGS